jgi:uncharacterized membrane protein YeiH
MNIETLFIWLDYAGIGFFAYSGGMLSARKALDPFGAIIVGAVTGMGGGTLRDVLLGELPVYWVAEPRYLAVAVGGAILGYFTSPWAQAIATRRAALIWADAIGLSVFCVIGAQAGLAAGAHWTIAVLTGMMSAAFGGLLRDIIVNEVPLILREDIYALAALAGAAGYVTGMALGFNPSAVTLASAALALTLRGCAIRFKWSLPPIRLGE